MFIEKIEIKNFRNILNGIFEPSKNINIIFGNNGNGKTSFIEAIYVVSNLQSFRTNNIKEAININKNEFEIKCSYIKNKSRELLELNSKKNKNQYSKNSKKINNDEYLSSITTIVFHPDDILYVNGPPILRRNLIDKSIFNIDKDHYTNLKKLNKSVKNKNICLKDENDKNIDEWDYLISKYSSLIYKKRKEYIDRINKIIIDKSNFKFSIDFNENEDDIDENKILEKILKEKNKEFKYKISLVGAHRQDIKINIENNDLKKFGSQGQKRSFILTYKSSQIDDFFSIKNNYPILLLDDMASELDNNNKSIILNIIDKYKGQTFITTTEKENIENKNSMDFYKVTDGSIYHFTRQGA